MKILFRADASVTIGSGHIVRTITLANALRSRGAECSFVCERLEGNLTKLVETQGFSIFDQTPENCHFDYLVVDHYQLDIQYEEKMRSCCEKIVVIDDLANRRHNAELLLDQNATASSENYRSLVNANCALLLGTKYALLQSNYALWRDQTSVKDGAIKTIFVYFGAADRDNLTIRTMLAFCDLLRDDLTLIVMPSSENRESIVRLAADRSNITVCERVDSLAPLLAKCDLVVGAGGTSSLERCAMGHYAIVIAIADNQIAISEELSKQGFIDYLGYKDRVDRQAIFHALKTRISSGNDPQKSAHCKTLTDARGVDRVANIMLLNQNTPLIARSATADDEALIFEWANDPLTRANSFNQGVIDPNLHHSWFSRKLAERDRCKILIVETAENLPIGNVRFDLENDRWKISYALADYARGRRLGSALLSTALAALQRECLKAKLFGIVKVANSASQRIFEELNFNKKAGENETVIYYN